MASPFSRIAEAILLLVTVPIVVHAQPKPRYDLEARIDPEGGRIAVRAVVQVPGHAVAEGRVLLDLGADSDGDPIVRIESLSESDGTRLDGEATPTPATIAVPLPTSSDGDTSIVVDYSVRLEPGDTEPFGYYLFGSIGPGSAWYPDIVNPDGSRDRFRDYAVRLEIPDGWAAITSGGLGSPEGSDRIRRYEADHVEGFALAFGEGFRTDAVERGGVPIAAFYHPDYADEFGQVVERTAEAAAWYRETYGFFPIPVVGIIQGHPRWGGGFPLPNLFMVHLGILRPDFLAFITAHELGHYYWGLTVLGDEERLDWLVLANGIWADQRYLAERSGRTIEEQWRHRGNGDWIGDYLTAVAADYEQELGIMGGREDSLDFDYNSFIRHGKGATGVYLQSRLLGYNRFLELQRRLLRDFRFRPLSLEAYEQALTRAGVEGAAAFFAAWRKGDAVIGMRVAGIEPDTAGFRTVFQRTGPVPYPVEVAVDTGEPEVIRHFIGADAWTDTLRTRMRPRSVALDPDGVLPMWNSSQPGMRSLIVESLFRAGSDDIAVALAREHLSAHPDNARLLFDLADHFFDVGRWEDVVSLWPEPGSCDSADRCSAGIIVARALRKLGRPGESAALLESLREGAESTGVGAMWERAAAENGD